MDDKTIDIAPLKGLTVVDFTTLAPGPFASLALARAGATVIKVERPGTGDEMRQYGEAFGDRGMTFSMLNAGKRSLEADLKNENDLSNIKSLLMKADVLMEQFRPGVMSKFGLDYATLAKDNPRLIYCAITGFGQYGPKSQIAAHDLNYVADAGMLSLGECPNGKPTVPPLLAADLAAGSYPALINILLALSKREASGKGVFIDISMTDNLFPLMFWALGLSWGSGTGPGPGRELLSGGSPRYQIYETADARHIAVAAIEQRFWDGFCEAIGLDAAILDEQVETSAIRSAIAAIIRGRTATHWRKRFQGLDVCAVVVNSLQEAVEDEHYRARGLFNQQIIGEQGSLLNSLPLPIIPALRSDDVEYPAVPKLGEFNAELKEFLK